MPYGTTSQNETNNDNTRIIRYRFVKGGHADATIPEGGPLACLIDELDARWAKTDRADSRRDRHTPLSAFPWAGPHFTDSTDIKNDYIAKDMVATALAGLSERQRFLVCAVVLDGYSFAELARAEGKNESAIRHAYNRAIKRARTILATDRPEPGTPLAYSAKQSDNDKE